MKIILNASLCIFLLCSCTEKSPDEQRIASVTKQAIIQKVTIAGNVEPVRKASIVAPYDGYIKKIFVKIGQDIKEGQNLLTLSESLANTEPLFPLKSPIAGRVVQVNKSEGEYVQKMGQENQMVRIDDLSNLFVYAKAPETDYMKIKVGQEVVVKATAISDKQYTGKVVDVFLASFSNNNQWGSRRETVEYPVKIEILDEGEEVKPGMSVIVDVIAEQKEEALALPHEYLFNREGKYFVTLVGGKEVEVKTGIRDDFHVEVIGLNEGDRVLLVDFYKEAQKGDADH